MKAKILLCTYFLCCTLPLLAQNPLVGTWVAKNDKEEEIKIITPTHFMFFIRPNNADTVNNGGGGTYAIKGHKYIEHLQTPDFTGYYVDQEPFKKLKAEFDFKVANDQFVQKGYFIVSDTEKYPIDHAFRRVKTANAYPENPAIGTWNQLSSTFWGADGNKQSHTNATATRVQIITPTHWMRTSTKAKTVENRMGGTYSMQGDKVYPNLEYASFPVNKAEKIEINQRVAGNKLYWSGTIKDAAGQTVFTFEDVFERLPGKVNKVAAAR